MSSGSAATGTRGSDGVLERHRQGEEIRYFLISFVDLFGAMRAKIVPAARMADMRKLAPALPVSPPGST